MALEELFYGGKANYLLSHFLNRGQIKYLAFV